MASDNGSFHVVLLTVNEKKIHFVRFLLKPKNISKPDIIYQLYIGSVRTVKYHDLGIENAELYQYIYFTMRTSRPANNIHNLPYEPA